MSTVEPSAEWLPALQDLLAQGEARRTPEAVRKAADSDAVAGVQPAAVVAARSEEDVIQTLRFASEWGLAVAPRGGGTQIGAGRPPERADILLDLSGLNRIIRYEPEDMTVAVQAGCTLERLQEELARRGQWLPVDPPASPASTIGGLVAADPPGLLQSTVGSWRDHVIGLRIVTPQGASVRAGGQVVKNVAGYELCKLHTGAWGTLGVIVSVDLKVGPLPSGRRALRIALRSPAELEEAAALLQDAVFPSFLAYADGPALRLLSFNGPAEHELCAGFIGTPEAVDWQVQETERRLGALGLVCSPAAWQAAYPPLRDAPLRFLRAQPQAAWVQAALLPSETHRFLAKALEILGGGGFAHAAVANALDGIVQMAVWPAESAGSGRGADRWAEAFDQLLEAAAAPPQMDLHAIGEGLESELNLFRELGRGNLTVVKAPTEILSRVRVWGRPPEGAGVMAQLKAAVDPAGTLNPGRLEEGWQTA